MRVIDWLFVAAVIAWLVFAIIYIIKHRGGCSCRSECSGDCAACHNACADKKKKP